MYKKGGYILGFLMYKNGSYILGFLRHKKGSYILGFLKYKIGNYNLGYLKLMKVGHQVEISEYQKGQKGQRLLICRYQIALILR